MLNTRLFLDLEAFSEFRAEVLLGSAEESLAGCGRSE